MNLLKRISIHRPNPPRPLRSHGVPPPSLAWVVLSLLLLPFAWAQAGEFQVSTAQELQNALTDAAGNGADDVILLATGYYSGNFNFNSAEARSLTLTHEGPSTEVHVDGTGTGLSMSLSSTGNSDITVRGVTFIRNAATGLRVATGTGAAILVEDCQFITRTNTVGGIGLHLVSGQRATVRGCRAMGNGSLGTGMGLRGLVDASVVECVFDSNGATLTDSLSSAGGGLYVLIDGNLVLLANAFTRNAAPAVEGSAGLGGGGFCAARTVLAVSNIFNACTATDGAGALLKAGSVAASNNTFTANTADVNVGGALSISGSSDTIFEVSGNVFTLNQGHGLLASGASGTIARNTFAENGGGARAAVNLLLTFKGNILTANGGPLVYAGGAFLEGPALEVSENQFIGSPGGYLIGGLACGGFTHATVASNMFKDNAVGAFLTWRSNGDLQITNNTFSGNSSTGHGGAVSCPLDVNGTIATLTLAGNVFRGNSSAGVGGAVHASSTTQVVLNNLFVDNSSGNAGGALWLNPLAQLDLVNNTLFGNSANAPGNASQGNGGGAALQVNGLTETLHVYNNIVWGNRATGKGADVYLAGTGLRKEFLYNNTDDMFGIWDLALHNLNVDPQFFDPINGDFHLRPTSGCANAGTNNAPAIPSLDLDGGARIVAGTVDLGCYEFANAAQHPADTSADWVLGLAEFNLYAAAWKTSQPWANGPSPVPADFVTRAGYLQQSGSTYHNDGSAQPVGWKPGAP